MILIFLVLLLVGCSTSKMDASPTNTAVQPTQMPTAAPATETPVPAMTATPSFSPSLVYTDDANAFKLDYPADWTLVPNVIIGSRGSQAQLFSPGTTAETLSAGGTRVTITVYDWDPKNDLKAYVDQRKIAFESSGSTITQEVSDKLTDGRGETHFILKSTGNEPTYVFIATIGEKYLQISGEGDLNLVDAIAHTLRP
jgi:hypothetical protein